VVLQRFRGELTLLDSRAGGEGRDSFGGEDRAPSFGRSSPAERRPATAGGGGGGGGEHFDDDIPF
jgi:single-strand DNA-binding protein